MFWPAGMSIDAVVAGTATVTSAIGVAPLDAIVRIT